jgi:hypothetical protein
MNKILGIKKPLSRIIKNDNFEQVCHLCHSTLKAAWFGFKPGCIQPECDNYYKKGKVE